MSSLTPGSAVPNARGFIPNDMIVNAHPIIAATVLPAARTVEVEARIRIIEVTR